MLYSVILLEQKETKNKRKHQQQHQKESVEDIHNTFTVSCENYKKVSFASSMIKNIVVIAFRFSDRFPVKLTCCIAFGSAPRVCCLIKFVAFIIVFI